MNNLFHVAFYLLLITFLFNLAYFCNLFYVSEVTTGCRFVVVSVRYSIDLKFGSWPSASREYQPDSNFSLRWFKNALRNKPTDGGEF